MTMETSAEKEPGRFQAITLLSWCDRAHCLLEDRASWGSHEGVKVRGSFNEPGIPSLIKWLMRSCCARCLEFKGKGQSGHDCALVKLHSPMRAGNPFQTTQGNRLSCRDQEGRRAKLPTSSGSLKKLESSRKTSISALLTTPKPLNGSQLWKILQDTSQNIGNKSKNKQMGPN